MWVKEKLLVTSNFSFSYNDFHSHISLVRQNAVLCGSGLTALKFRPISSLVTAMFSDKPMNSSRYAMEDIINKKNLYPWIGEE